MHNIFSYALIVFAALSTIVSGFCCGNTVGVCADGTDGTPCCATRSCNIFCCACGGRCRGSGKRSLASPVMGRATEAGSIFTTVNKAGDGKLTLGEYLEWARSRNTADEAVNDTVWENYFKSFDKDNKGFVSVEEVGPSA